MTLISLFSVLIKVTTTLMRCLFTIIANVRCSPTIDMLVNILTKFGKPAHLIIDDCIAV